MPAAWSARDWVWSRGSSKRRGPKLQRLMIARAVVARPRILLFEEATSALDNATQAIVSRSLESLQATRIVIAHRLSTVQHADRILVLQAGRIVESGSHARPHRQRGTVRRTRPAPVGLTRHRVSHNLASAVFSMATAS